MKKSLGRRKIEIRKIEKKSNLQVTFSKRRTGLFKKASELALLCGAQIAILVQSPAGKIYSFGHAAVDDLINSFLKADLPPTPMPQIIDGRSRCEEAAMRLEKEKKAWELYQLEEYLKALQILRDQVLEKVDQIMRSRIDQAAQ